MKKPAYLLSVMLGILFVLSLARVSDNITYGVIDFFSHFPFQYALISLALMFVCLWKKAILIAIGTGLLFVFNMGAISGLEKSIEAAGHTGDMFKVYSANINKDNRDLTNLKHEIQEIDPDIVFLLEVSSYHVEPLLSIEQKYVYRIRNVSDEAPGFVFLSRFPIQEHHITKLSNYGNSRLEAMLKISQKPVLFYGIHAQRPDRGNFEQRKNQFLTVSRQIDEQELPAIVTGDFNTTPYSPVFRSFVRTSGLKDSREGFGWLPSWPSYFPPFWIPIDHVLVSPDIMILNRITGSYIGSDHYPVIAELSLG